MLTASFCIQYIKFYCLTHLATVEASNRLIPVAVDNSHFFIHIGKTMPHRDVKHRQTSRKVICKFRDIHSILCIERSQFYIKPCMTSFLSINAYVYLWLYITNTFDPHRKEASFIVYKI